MHKFLISINWKINNAFLLLRRNLEFIFFLLSLFSLFISFLIYGFVMWKFHLFFVVVGILLYVPPSGRSTFHSVRRYTICIQWIQFVATFSILNIVALLTIVHCPQFTVHSVHSVPKIQYYHFILLIIIWWIHRR